MEQQELMLLKEIRDCCDLLEQQQKYQGPHEFAGNLTTATVLWLQAARIAIQARK